MSTVPMVNPADGTSADVPLESVAIAMSKGAKMAAKMVGPDGSNAYVPFESIAIARQKGAKLASEVPTQFENERNPANQQGGLASYAGELGNVAKGVLSAGNPLQAVQGIRRGVQEFQTLSNTGQTIAQQEDAARKQAGRSLPYRAVAQLGSAAGANVSEMEHQSDIGNARGVLGVAAADVTPAVLPEVARRAGPAATEMAARFANEAPKSVATAADKLLTPRTPQTSVMPEIRNMPAKAVAATEKIYRASAPTGTNPKFRENLYAAVNDLQQIGDAVNWDASKGGIRAPDMRVRATVDAINGHLDQMYQQERAPQIAAHAELPVDIQLGDATRGLQYLKRSAGTLADQALAEKAIKTGTLSMADADQLAKTANQYLKSYESMTASEKLEAVSKTPKIAGLKALDQSLSKGINKGLMENGEPGLYSYERRYAALSEIRDQLQSRMNATELPQPGMIRVAGKWVKSLAGGPKGVASASQAATADVNIGRMLQEGFQTLSGMK